MGRRLNNKAENLHRTFCLLFLAAFGAITNGLSAKTSLFDDAVAEIVHNCEGVYEELGGKRWGTRSIRINQSGRVAFLRTSVSVEREVVFDARDIIAKYWGAGQVIELRTYPLGEESGPKLIKSNNRPSDIAWIDCRNPAEVVTAFENLREELRQMP